jgi:hypothetical protein
MNKTKLTSGIIMVLAVLGGLFLVLTVYYAVEDNNSDYIGYHYEEGFIEGCTGEGATQGACQCMFDYIDNNMTNTELIAFSSLDNIEEHQMFNRAINACY